VRCISDDVTIDNLRESMISVGRARFQSSCSRMNYFATYLQWNPHFYYSSRQQTYSLDSLNYFVNYLYLPFRHSSRYCRRIKVAVYLYLLFRHFIYALRWHFLDSHRGLAVSCPCFVGGSDSSSPNSSPISFAINQNCVLV